MVSWARCGFRRDPLGLLLRLRTEPQLVAERLLASGSLHRGTVDRSKPRILVVIPFRDGWSLTNRCLQTLVEQRLEAGSECLVALIDNGSCKVETGEGLEAFLRAREHERERQPQAGLSPMGFCLIRDGRPFNFSRLNNGAVASTTSFDADVVVFVNNDLEFRGTADLSSIVDFVWKTESAGAVGSTLLYPDNTIQHLFLSPGIKIVAAHPGKGEPYRAEHPWFDAPRAVPAVTGALLAVRKSDFLAVGGFDERLASCGQDLDLCLKLEALGRQNWVLPSVVATHFEGKTRGFSFNRAEIELLYERWGKTLTHHSQVSPRLSRWSELPTLASGEGDYPWWCLL
jgi:hypothetical protein